MSAIADFRLIEVSKLNDLIKNAEIIVEKKLFSKKIIDNYWTYLNANSQKLKDFNESGYIFVNLLVFFEEKKGIDLLNSSYDESTNVIAEKRKNSTLIFTFDHKQKYFNELSPDKFSIAELIEFNTEFSEEDDPALAKAQIAGIQALRDSLALLEDDKKIVLLSIG